MAESATDKRPSPDALLAEAGREHRGRLKIFLGAAPGVGKTWEMLSSAHARLRDVSAGIVVGVVATHRRPDTLPLAQAPIGHAHARTQDPIQSSTPSSA